MPEFDLKLIPKDKADLTKFKNFHPVGSVSFNDFNGKVVYLNANHPDSHIYQPYFIRGGTAHTLSYSNDSKLDIKYPLFTLQELSYDDTILYYTQDDIDKIEAAKKTTKNTKTP